MVFGLDKAPDQMKRLLPQMNSHYLKYYLGSYGSVSSFKTNYVLLTKKIEKNKGIWPIKKSVFNNCHWCAMPKQSCCGQSLLIFIVKQQPN